MDQIQEDQHDIRNLPALMSKKVYKEMIKKLDKIASQEEPSQQHRASRLYIH